MVEVLFLLIAVTLPTYGLARWALSRYRLIRYLGEFHPKLWTTLRVSDAAGEVSGYPTDLARWVSSRAYMQCDDPQLSELAVRYARAKFVVIPCILVGLVLLSILSSNG